MAFATSNFLQSEKMQVFKAITNVSASNKTGKRSPKFTNLYRVLGVNLHCHLKMSPQGYVNIKRNYNIRLGDTLCTIENQISCLRNGGLNYMKMRSDAKLQIIRENSTQFDGDLIAILKCYT